MLINSLKRQNPSRGRQSSDNGPRIFAVTTFVILYFIFAVLLGIRLQGWDANSAGGCYESGVMTIEYLKHPVPDLTYLGITAPVLIIAILGSTLSAAHAEDFWHNGILFIAVLEASFHFFSIIVHRATKQNFLVSDQSDNEFGFGQIMVMVLLLSIPFECYKSFQGAYVFPHDLNATRWGWKNLLTCWYRTGRRPAFLCFSTNRWVTTYHFRKCYRKRLELEFISLQTHGCLPPLISRKGGRPKTTDTRKRERHQKKKTKYSNSWCGQEGHNKRSCRIGNDNRVLVEGEERY
jgi:hypothetical protein